MITKQLQVVFICDMIPLPGSTFDVHNIVLRKAVAHIDNKAVDIIIEPDVQMIPLSLYDANTTIVVRYQFRYTDNSSKTKVPHVVD